MKFARCVKDKDANPLCILQQNLSNLLFSLNKIKAMCVNGISVVLRCGNTMSCSRRIFDRTQISNRTRDLVVRISRTPHVATATLEATARLAETARAGSKHTDWLLTTLSIVPQSCPRPGLRSPKWERRGLASPPPRGTAAGTAQSCSPRLGLRARQWPIAAECFRS